MLRFTMRDVLWVTALVGIVVTWWIDHCAAQAANQALRKQNAGALRVLLQARSTVGQYKMMLIEDIAARDIRGNIPVPQEPDWESWESCFINGPAIDWKEFERVSREWAYKVDEHTRLVAASKRDDR